MCATNVHRTNNKNRMALSRAHVPPTKVFRWLSKQNHFKTTARSSSVYTWDFPDVKFHIAALIRYRRKQSESGSKVNQFVHVPTSVDTPQHVIQIHARIFE